MAPCWRWLGELLVRLSRSEAFGYHSVGRRVECHSDVCAWNFHVHFRVHGHAVAPVHETVMARIDRGLDHLFGNLASQGVQEIASTSSRIAVGQYSAAMLLENPEANCLGSGKNRWIRNRAAYRRGERGHRSHVFRALARDRTGDHSSKAVTN